MKSVKVCEYSRSRSFHYDLILQDQASGERSQDQWSSVFFELRYFPLYYCHMGIYERQVLVDFFFQNFFKQVEEKKKKKKKKKIKRFFFLVQQTI